MMPSLNQPVDSPEPEKKPEPQTIPGKKTWPAWKQWRQLPKTLNTKETFQILAGAFLVIASLTAWLVIDRITNYQTVAGDGGEFSEGLIGQPQYLNPLLSDLNSVDKDITGLIYSGLLKIDSENGFEPDLAEKYEISEDGKTYTVWLKDNIKWQDGKPLTMNDVVFTFDLLKNPDAKSPLRSAWQGIQFERVDEKTIKFYLEKSSFSFLHNLTTGILPAHIWGEFPTRSLSLATPNLTPVGSGPYQFEKLTKDGTGYIQSLVLKVNPHYYSQKPKIEQITFKFYETENEATAAWNNSAINALGNVSGPMIQYMKYLDQAEMHKIRFPRYFAIFFNQTQSRILADKNVRAALNLAVNKKAIVKSLAASEAEPINVPFLQEKYQFVPEFNFEKAVEILENSGWTFSSDSPFRAKKIDPKSGPQNLSLTLTVPDVAELRQVGELIKQQWTGLGIDVKIDYKGISSIQSESIRPRSYEALLFGLSQGIDPDPYIFWHSSQKQDPGLNLCLYDNGEADALLDQMRVTINKQDQEKMLVRLNELILTDLPAIFLYNPYYIYITNQEIKGITLKNLSLPSQRFAEIENWHINTERIRK